MKREQAEINSAWRRLPWRNTEKRLRANLRLQSDGILAIGAGAPVAINRAFVRENDATGAAPDESGMDSRHRLATMSVGTGGSGMLPVADTGQESQDLRTSRTLGGYGGEGGGGGGSFHELMR